MPKTTKASSSSTSASKSLSLSSTKDKSPPKPGSERHVSCEGCRRRKMKCSRTYPCQSCILRNEKCVWSGKNAPAESFNTTSDELIAAQEQTRKLRQIQDILLRRIIELEKEKGLPSIENDSLALEEMLARLDENDGKFSQIRGSSKGSSSSLSSLGEFKEYTPFSHSDSSTSSSFVQSPLTLSPTFGPFPTLPPYFDSSITQSIPATTSTSSGQLIYRPHSIPDFTNYSESNRHLSNLYPSNVATESGHQNQGSNALIDSQSIHYLPIHTSSTSSSSFPTILPSPIIPDLPQVPYQYSSQSHTTSLPYASNPPLPAQTSPAAINYGTPRQAGSFAGRYDYALSLRAAANNMNKIIPMGEDNLKAEEGIEKDWWNSRS